MAKYVKLLVLEAKIVDMFAVIHHLIDQFDD